MQWLEILELSLIFAKIGLFTIGGGYAMIPLIQNELVSRGLFTQNEIVDIIAISEMTPGPFSVNAATFCGMKLYSLPGAICTTLGVMLPSVIIILIAAKFFFNINKTPVMKSILSGVRPVVLALILASTISIAITALTGVPTFYGLDIACLALTAVVLAGITWTKVSPVLLILASGVLGAVFLR